MKRRLHVNWKQSIGFTYAYALYLRLLVEYARYFIDYESLTHDIVLDVYHMFRSKFVHYKMMIDKKNSIY